MSLLDHLWDDTVAGPPPSGLNGPDDDPDAGGSLQVTRSITILRPESPSVTGSRTTSDPNPPPPAAPTRGSHFPQFAQSLHWDFGCIVSILSELHVTIMLIVFFLDISPSEKCIF